MTAMISAFAAAWVLGIAGGLHCGVMCGPLVLAAGAAARSAGATRWWPWAYHSGRVATYVVLGVMFGALGEGLRVAGFQRATTVGLGLLLVAGALGWGGVRGKAWAAGAAAGLSGWMRPWLGRRGLTGAVGVGMVNGLLPCGLVYVAGAGAAATGHWWSGAMFMGMFGLGTAPVWLAFSALAPWVGGRWRGWTPRVLVGCQLMLGLVLVLRGLELGIPYVSPVLAGGAGVSVSCH